MASGRTGQGRVWGATVLGWVGSGGGGGAAPTPEPGPKVWGIKGPGLGLEGWADGRAPRSVGFMARTAIKGGLAGGRQWAKRSPPSQS